MGAFLETAFGALGDLGDLAADSMDFAGADLLVKNSNIYLYYRASTGGMAQTQAVRLLSAFRSILKKLTDTCYFLQR